MRAKRYLSLLLAAALALALAGCGANEDSGKHAAMSIWPAQLSEEENALTELLGIGMHPYRIFDFQMGDSPNGVQSILLRAYELVDGEWEVKAESSHLHRRQGAAGAHLRQDDRRGAHRLAEREPQRWNGLRHGGGGRRIRHELCHLQAVRLARHRV